MTRIEAAELLERLAIDVEHLPGVSRINPHAFGEAKSDLAHKMRLEAKQLRIVPAAPRPVQVLQPGSVQVGRRMIAVEVRRRRA